MNQSNAYFAEVAEQWDALRTGYFTEAMRDAAIAKACLPPEANVADIGTGTGFVAAGLAPQARHVYGIDASPEMLKLARRKLSHFSNVTFQVAEGLAIPLPSGTLDGVFANMYLHHATDPMLAIQEMVRVLKPGGVLCITDLDSHSNTWFQDEMADLWCGFEREKIRSWYNTAGLEHVEVGCAEGTCQCTAPTGELISVTVFVALGRRPLAPKL